jgi:hypothetical protein
LRAALLVPTGKDDRMWIGVSKCSFRQSKQRNGGELMKGGQCPKCQGTDIRVIEQGKVKYSHRNFLRFSAITSSGLHINEYVCMNCGYIESYFAEEDMSNLKDAANNQQWRKA